MRVWLFYWVPACAGTTDVGFLHSLHLVLTLHWCLVAIAAKVVRTGRQLFVKLQENHRIFLKNTIDWASRSEVDGETPLAAYKGKFAGIMAASPSRLGGLQGLVFLRMLLNNLGVTVLAEQLTVAWANHAFAQDGVLIEDRKQQAAIAIGVHLTQLISHTRN